MNCFCLGGAWHCNIIPREETFRTVTSCQPQSVSIRADRTTDVRYSRFL